MNSIVSYVVFYLIMLAPLAYGDFYSNSKRWYNIASPIPFYVWSYFIEWIFIGIAMVQNNIFEILFFLFVPIIIIRFLQMEKNREFNIYRIWIKSIRKMFTDVLFTLGGVCGILGENNFLSSSIQSFLNQLTKNGIIINSFNKEEDFFIFIVMLGVNRIVDLIIHDYNKVPKTS